MLMRSAHLKAPTLALPEVKHSGLPFSIGIELGIPLPTEAVMVSVSCTNPSISGRAGSGTDSFALR
jgi:hypothetical protein